MPVSKRFEDALIFAVRLHARQRRARTNTPEVSHLLGVTSIVLEHGGNEDEAIASLLHEAAEDAKAPRTLQKIRELFGDEVVRIIEGVNDSPLIEPKPPWRQRKEDYLAHLMLATEPVRLVAAADKLHNARALLRDYREEGEAMWERYPEGKDNVLWYYRALTRIYLEGGPTRLGREIDGTIARLEELVRPATPAPA